MPYSPLLSQRTWFIALMLFCFFPVGLYLTWVNPAWSQRTKMIVTGVTGLLVILAYLRPEDKANNKPVGLVKVDPATGALKPVSLPSSTRAKLASASVRTVPKPRTTPKPLFVKAVTLFDAYADNPIKADDDYKSKDVIIEGFVGYMDASLGTPAVNLIGNEPEPHVHCVMKEDSATRANLAKLHTGKVAFIRGKFAGRFLGIIGLTEGEVSGPP